MVYDAKRKVIVLYGGHNRSATFGDTWEWDGKNWIKRCDFCAPGLRSAERMFYDPIREKVVLYGGYKDTTFFNDAWEWDGDKWLQITINGMSPVASGFDLAYDKKQSHLVVQLPGCCGETWIWEETWKRLSLDLEPSTRTDFSMIYDPYRNAIILFGGINKDVVLGDTWEFKGDKWVKLENVSPVLGNRWGYIMFFDAVRGHIVMFGGYNNVLFNDMWEYIPGNDQPLNN